jgi:hypothetical protein
VQRIRAGAALCRDDFLTASDHWRAAAALSGNAARSGEFQIRALFAEGLAERYDSTIEGLRQLAIPEVLEPLRQRALGWMLILRGDTADGAAAFRDAAHASLREGDTDGAAVALRAVAWDYTRAADLERITPRAQRDVESIRSLIHTANADLVTGKLRSAAIHAQQAYLHALQHLDPLGLEWARTALASVWLRVAELEPGEDELASAAVSIAHSGPETGTDRPPKPLEVFAKLAVAHATPNGLRRIVTDLMRAGWGSYELTGSLRVLNAIIDLIPSHLLDLVINTLVKGLRRGWSANAKCNAPAAACELIGRVAERLAPANQIEVRDALLALFEATSPRHMYARKLYTALASMLGTAPLPDDGGTHLAERLLAEWEQSVPSMHPPILFGCLATLAERAQPELRGRILKSLAAHASHDRWRVLFALARAGEQIAVSDADDFLADRKRVLAARLTRVGTSVSLGPVDSLWRIAEVIAPAASANIRDETLSLALRFLREERLDREDRADWIMFVAVLAAQSDELRSRAVELLDRIASYGFEERGNPGAYSDHPLDSFRYLGGASAEGARVIALSALGYLYGSADLPLREQIEETLRSAAGEDSAIIRAAAIRGRGWIVETLWKEQASRWDETAIMVLHATADSDPTVRSEAWAVVEACPDAFAALDADTGKVSACIAASRSSEITAGGLRSLEDAEQAVTAVQIDRDPPRS